MALSRFDYVAARSIEEACAALAQHPDEAKLIAGGQSLLRVMKFRLIAPSYLIDLKTVPDLDYVEDRPDGLRIGALATSAKVLRTDAVRRGYPVLADAVAEIASEAVRNWGTLAGNVCVGHTASDPAAALLALGATVSVTGPKKKRDISMQDFFRGHLATDLDPTEVVTEIRVDRQPDGCGMAYFAHTGRQAMETPLISVAAIVKLEAGRCSHVRIALAGAAETPIRAIGAEQLLQGQKPDDKAISAVAEKAREECSPDSDVYASADYRRRLVGVYVRDAVKLAASRAAGAQ